MTEMEKMFLDMSTSVKQQFKQVQAEIDQKVKTLSDQLSAETEDWAKEIQYVEDKIPTFATKD